MNLKTVFGILVPWHCSVFGEACTQYIPLCPQAEQSQSDLFLPHPSDGPAPAQRCLLCHCWTPGLLPRHPAACYQAICARTEGSVRLTSVNMSKWYITLPVESSRKTEKVTNNVLVTWRPFNKWCNGKCSVFFSQGPGEAERELSLWHC